MHQKTSLEFKKVVSEVPGGMRRPTEMTQEALRRIAELYAIEAEIRGSPAEERLAVRKARSEPPRVPGECFICELRLPDASSGWKRDQAFSASAGGCRSLPAIVDCYTSPPT